MIFCLNGTFLENSLAKQNFSSAHMLAVCMQGRERVFPLFLRLAALCMVLLRRSKILLGRWISGNARVLLSYSMAFISSFVCKEILTGFANAFAGLICAQR